jgi:long-subunit fatty acid transport protein
MGTGGAFIAIADDATAANWNPGGLTQLVLPEMSMVYTYEDKDLDGTNVNFRSLNYLSAVYPFSIGEVNLVTSLNFQKLYDFYFDNNFDTQTRKLDMDATMLGVVTGDTIAVEKHYKDDLSRVIGSNQIVGEVGALSPAIAVQLTPSFAMGFAYNFWKDGMVGPRYENQYGHSRQGTFNQYAEVYFDDRAPRCTCDGGQTCDDTAVPPRTTIDNPSCLASAELLPGSTAFAVPINYNSQYKSTQDISFSGQNFNVGLLWKASPRITLGAVYRSEFTADLRREQRVQIIKTNYQAGTYNYHWKFHEKMRFPASYGVGAAFRYSDNLSLALDVSRIEWDRFTYEYEDGAEVSPVNGVPLKNAGIDPTMTYRLGAEYLVIRPKYVVPIRGGFFYDPEPARDNPDDYYGASLGTGLASGPLILDLTYWYRWGNDVTLYTTYNSNTGRIKENRGDIIRQMVMLSAIIHLD